MHATAPHALSQQGRNSTQKRKFALLLLLLFLLVIVFGGFIVFTSNTSTNTISDKNGLFVTELEQQEDERRTTTLTITKTRKAKERHYDENAPIVTNFLFVSVVHYDMFSFIRITRCKRVFLVIINL